MMDAELAVIDSCTNTDALALAVDAELVMF